MGAIMGASKSPDNFSWHIPLLHASHFLEKITPALKSVQSEMHRLTWSHYEKIFKPVVILNKNQCLYKAILQF